MKNRLSYLDYAKGFGVTLLLFAHTMNIEEHYVGIWISSFFMPIFFVVSGMILALKYGKKSVSMTNLLILAKKRLFQLGIPYIVFCLLLTLFYSVLAIISGSKPNIWYYLIRIVTLRGINSLWFIPVFFFTEIVFVLLLIPQRIGKWIRIAALLIGLLLAGFRISSEYYVFFFVIRVLVCLAFTYSGYLFFKYSIIYKIPIWIAVLLIAVGIPLSQINGAIGVATLELNNGWLFIINALISSFGFIAAFSYIEKQSIKLHFLEYFGANSIVILCTNNLLIESIRLFDSKVSGSILIHLGIWGSIILTVILMCIEALIIKISLGKLGVIFGRKNEGNTMNIFASIQARQKKHLLDSFSNSKHAKVLKQFQGIHQNESCFIIGNGPSLCEKDLEQIGRMGLSSFAFNRIYLMFKKTNWRPTYYISQDNKMLGNCTEEVNCMDLQCKFIPYNLKLYFDIQIDNALYFKMVNSKGDYPVLSDDISIQVENSNTVAVTAAQFAAYMGFKKIYLIGVDHNFSTYQNDKGEIIHDNTAKDYFTDEYNKDKAELYVPNIDASTRAFISMKKFCDEKGIDVYNATRGGKLEVFPRVDFDEVINNI